MRLSAVVVSRGRPALLARCLTALRLQDHGPLEVVLVSDAQGLAVCPDLAIKRVAFDRPNIAQARNLGIEQAAGDIIAFIDDDAVAEPCWASALAAAFADEQVIAATGATLGPDGVRWQVQAEWLNADGPKPLRDHTARLWFPQSGGTLSTIGTNCAFRREALVRVGGFDAQFAFHLDESDLNMRLAAACPHRPTAFVPDARIIHAAATGTTRKNGAPMYLHAIGRSEAIFARRHRAMPGWQDRLRRRERARLLRAMLAGRLDPLHLPRVMSGLEAGLAEGEGLAEIAPIWHDLSKAAANFLPVGTRMRPHRVMTGWHWQAGRLRARAARCAAQGELVSLMLWSASFLPHRERFVAGGWWERTGGLWGAAMGDPPVVRSSRAAREDALSGYWARTRGGRDAFI